MSDFNKRVSQKVSKLSQLQIEQLFESLTDKNEVLSSIFDSLSTGLIALDANWKIIFSNKVASRYIKSSLADLKDENIELWKIVKDEEISAFFEECYTSDKTNVSKEFTISTSGGSARFITITITPLVQQDRITGSIVTIQDITEKRNQDILLHRMESLASLTTLAANVAHEIKNPLAAISIHIQLMQKAIAKARSSDNVLPDERFMEKYLQVVNQEINNLNKIVVDFLFAVRPVSANLELINPDKIIKSFTEFFLPQFQKEDVTLSVSLSKTSTRLLIDEKLFREVLLNISQNALAAILEKKSAQKEQGMLSVYSEVKNDKYILTLKDNGIGMNEKTLSHIFEPYYTTKATGTGLGLTMVYKIVKEFSGDIDVKSKRGKGSVFTISIPIPQTDKRLLSNDKIKDYPVKVIKGEGK